MNEREMLRTLAYVGVTFVLLLVTQLNPFGGAEPPADIVAGGRFFEEFEDFTQATTLEVFDWDEESGGLKEPFKVEFRGGVWRIPSKQDYPADAKDKMGKVAAALMNLEKTQLRSAREEDHALLGVVNPTADGGNKGLEGRGRRVRMTDAGGKVLADLVIGKEVEGSQGQRYVRRMTSDQEGDKEVYAAPIDLEVSTEFTDWIHTDLLELAVADVTSLTIDRSKLRVIETEQGMVGEPVPGKKSDIGQQGSSWSVQGMPEGHEADMTVIDKVTEALKELAIKDVYKREVASLMQVGFYPLRTGEFFSDEGEIGIALKNGVRYVVRFGRPAPSTEGVRRFMIVSAELDAAITKGFDKAKLKVAASKVANLNKRFGDWYYVISATDFQNLRPPHDKLTKVKEKDEEGDDGHDDHDDHGGVEPAPADDPLKSESPFPAVPPFEDRGAGAVPPKKDEVPQPPKEDVTPPAPKEDDATYQKAITDYKAAMQVWKTDATQCQALLETALGHLSPTSTGRFKLLRANLNLILGQLHQGKTADFKTATGYYRSVLRENLGVEDPRIKNLKAQALLNLGTMAYSVQRKVTEAVIKYQDAHKTFPTAQTADSLSQILFRQARDPKVSVLARKKKIDSAEALAREALMIDAQDPNSKPHLRAKYRLQLVLVLTAREKKAEADAEWAKVDAKVLGDTALYQLAQLAALQGKDAKAVGDLLTRANTAGLRPKAAARNQLRWFIRTEGDFAGFLADPTWKALVTDESEK
jgi:tetratricopeptide (TPR) repeat protein